MATSSPPIQPRPARAVKGPWAKRLRLLPVALATGVMILVAAIALLAPWLAPFDPVAIAPANRLKVGNEINLLGTDGFGRDVLSRLIHGARVSLTVGLVATTISVALGLVIGVVAGYFRLLDAVVMRIMDGIMAIPGVLLAIALISLTGASLGTVLIAIIVPEIPRVVRLVRSVILDVRAEPYVEAAQTLGTRIKRMLVRHMVPSTISPLIVQGTFIFASAVLTESTLSFLGAGLPAEISSWGNMMADGRMFFQIHPTLVLYPGLALAVMLLCVNLLGDALRDRLDPKMVTKR